MNPSVRIRCPFCCEPLRIKRKKTVLKGISFSRLAILYAAILNAFNFFGVTSGFINEYGEIAKILPITPFVALMLIAVAKNEFRISPKEYVSARMG